MSLVEEIAAEAGKLAIEALPDLLALLKSVASHGPADAQALAARRLRMHAEKLAEDEILNAELAAVKR